MHFCCDLTLSAVCYDISLHVILCHWSTGAKISAKFDENHFFCLWIDWSAVGCFTKYIFIVMSILISSSAYRFICEVTYLSHKIFLLSWKKKGNG